MFVCSFVFDVPKLGYKYQEPRHEDQGQSSGHQLQQWGRSQRRQEPWVGERAGRSDKMRSCRVLEDEPEPDPTLQ